MKVRELISALSAADPDAEVLINREIDDDESTSRTNFKLVTVLPAFAEAELLAHINWDICHYSNGDALSQPVVILSDESVINYRIERHGPGHVSLHPIDAALAEGE